MRQDFDHYQVYYADKLWQLLPAVYRSQDSAVLDKPGPLGEMVNRIGVQAAVLRRSIDRLWEDQSIETCDDWVIAYIGDLLATNLVSSLDARGQRLDVANTIDYRRRKGTIAMLEELANDITGWEVRVVEFFGQMSRMRHNLDPEIGQPAANQDPKEIFALQQLQQAQGLVGKLTKTSLGGWADLRHVYGATKAHSAFDEFFHTADMRRGREQIGWYNIPRLGVFLWRLRSFGVKLTTPVLVKGCTNVQYTFDPTGRDIPLFAAASRTYGDLWVSPEEWQLPVELNAPLLEEELEHLYASQPNNSPLLDNSLGVFDSQGKLIPLELTTIDGQGKPIKIKQITADPRKWSDSRQNPNIAYLIDPQRGRLIAEPKALKVTEEPGVTEESEVPVLVTYHYGFSSTIGAGPYDRRLFKTTAIISSSVPDRSVEGGKDGLTTALEALSPTDTLEICDSLTYGLSYDAKGNVRGELRGIQAIAIRAKNKHRPVIRLPEPKQPETGAINTELTPAQWVLEATASQDAKKTTLVLEGLLISGGDVVLKGHFDHVILSCCTLDPGDFNCETDGTVYYKKAADKRDLIPCHLKIEGHVELLTVERCILGPIQTTGKGTIQTLQLRNSIVQGLASDKALDLSSGRVELVRCTLLGGANVHRLTASESIMDDLVQVTDRQHSCVRFSAWVNEKDSKVPRPYESVEIPRRAPLFTSRRFGHPGYAQLQLGADKLIQDQTGGGKPTILEGAEDGSEMGAFAGEKNAIKMRSLRIKYKEFMPLGLIPVIIPVT